MPSRAGFFLVAAAGVLGAAGVALAAVAAHRVASPVLATAATMLMIHAGAVLAIAAFSAVVQNKKRWLGVGAVMAVGAALFSGDIALNTLAQIHAFPMAAPVGGSVLIASWLAVAVCAGIGAARREG